MVKEICASFLAFTFVLCRVSAYHPIPKGLSPQSSNDGGDGLRTENPNQIQRLDLLRLDNEIDKRGPDRNFLRFGKSESSSEKLYLPEDFTEEEKKAARNFLRFGRVPQRNFLRFGRSGSPLAFGLGLEPNDDVEELEKRADARNFFRFGKAADRNFLRYGRSANIGKNVDCNDCTKKTKETSKPVSSDQEKNHYSSSTKTTNRVKRSVAAFYDDAEFFPHTHVTWSPPQYGALEPMSQNLVGINEDMSNIAQKRAHGRSFLRYGRDPLDLHFLRFGKRGSSEEETKSLSDVDEEDFNRYLRGGTTKNFIRFG